MPNNYVLLERIELNASASSVTFSNIPQTGYTDLKIVVSARSNRAAVYDYCKISFNGVSTNQSMRVIRGENTTASSYSDTLIYSDMDGNTATSSTFGNTEFYIPNYTSSNFKSVSSDGVAETNAAAALMELAAGLWSSTAAITSITLTPYYSTFMAGSTFSLYGIANSNTTPAIAPKADGGNVIATDGTYWYHAFLANGTFAPQTNLSCDVLVVAGGGGSGYFDLGGAGGAGGLSYQAGRAVTSSVAVQVGAGGTGANPAGGQGGNGVNSIFDTIISNGGGGGGGGGAEDGKVGGSGGAGAAGSPLNTSSNGGSANQGNTGGATGYGFAGGGGYINVSSYGATGGGGGAGAAGTNGTVPSNAIGGNGGNGLNTWSSWATITGTGDSGYYAGGGAGAAGNVGAVNGSRGLGGGGAAGTAGYANTGGGSGGGSGTNGGSGIVIVRYLVA